MKVKLLHDETHGFNEYALWMAMAQIKADTVVRAELPRGYRNRANSLISTTSRLRALYMDLLGGRQLRGHTLQLISNNMCCRCSEELDPLKPHMEIEIAIHIPTDHSIHMSNAHKLSSYCNKCSEKLFSVSDDGFTDFNIFE
jgi:hypothetical protein